MKRINHLMRTVTWSVAALTLAACATGPVKDPAAEHASAQPAAHLGQAHPTLVPATTVIPAKAGIQLFDQAKQSLIPAYAGMTTGNAG